MSRAKNGTPPCLCFSKRGALSATLLAHSLRSGYFVRGCARAGGRALMVQTAHTRAKRQSRCPVEPVSGWLGDKDLSL